MTAVLVTGMSGTGKSSVLAELRARGFETVDTDEPGWTVWSDDEDGYVWDETQIAELLAAPRNGTLFVSGTVSNQGRFYARFGAVVLLSASREVLLDRVATRTTNDYGKSDDERARFLDDLARFEPQLRATCTHEIDASAPLDAVVAELLRICAALDG